MHCKVEGAVVGPVRAESRVGLAMVLIPAQSEAALLEGVVIRMNDVSVVLCLCCNAK